MIELAWPAVVLLLGLCLLRMAWLLYAQWLAKTDSSVALTKSFAEVDTHLSTKAEAALVADINDRLNKIEMRTELERQG